MKQLTPRESFKRKVIGKVFEKVNQKDPEKAKQLVQILEEFSGDFPSLNAILQYTGTHDPYEAFSLLRFKTPIFRTEQEIKQLKEKKEYDELGYSISGQKLKKRGFPAVHKTNPLKKPTLFGEDTLLTQAKYFGTQEITDMVDVEKRKQRVKAHKEKNHEILLDAGKALEKLSKEENTFINATQELKKLIKTHKGSLKDLLQLIQSNISFYDFTKKDAYLLSTSKESTFNKVYRNNLNNLPIAIRDAYMAVTDEFSIISDKQRQEITEGLIAYIALKAKVKTEVITRGIEKDLEFIKSNPELKQSYEAILSKSRKRKEIKESPASLEQTARMLEEIKKQPEISLLKAAEIYAQNYFTETRLKENKQRLVRFESELEEILKQDTQKEVYQALLNPKERGAVNEIRNIKTIVRYEDGLCKVLDMQTFKEYLEDGVIAKRKLSYINQQIQEQNLIINKKEDVEKFEKQGNLDLLKSKTFELTENFEEHYELEFNEFLKRAEYLKNNFWHRHGEQIKKEAETGLFNNNAARRKEIETRIRFIKSLTPYKEWEQKYLQAQEFSEKYKNIRETGLTLAFYLPELPSKERMGGYGESFDPDKKYFTPGEKESIRVILKSGEEFEQLRAQYGKRVNDYLAWREQLLKSNIFKKRINTIRETVLKKDNIENLFQVQSQIQPLQEQHKKQLQQYTEYKQELEKARFYSGNTESEITMINSKTGQRFKKRVVYVSSKTWDEFSTYDKEFEDPTKRIGEFEIIDSERINETVNKFNESYVKAGELGTKWRNKLIKLTTYKGTELLKEAGMWFSQSTISNQSFELKNHDYVKRSFANEINKLYNKLTKKS